MKSRSNAEPEAQPQGRGLLPCPFCPSLKVMMWVSEKDKEKCCCGFCEGCQAEGPHANTEEEAARRWNRRADLPRATGAVDAESDELVSCPDCVEGKITTGCSIDKPLISVDCGRCKGTGRIELPTINLPFSMDDIRRNASTPRATAEATYRYGSPKEQAERIVKTWRATGQYDKLLVYYIAQAIRDNAPRVTGETTVEAWQPIETAPKDGTPILIAYLEYGVGPSFLVSSASWCEDGWKGCPTDRDFYFPPAYWQSLPTPPRMAQVRTPPARKGKERSRNEYD